MPTEHGPWTRLSSEIAYENPWIRVRHDTVTTPAGSEGVYGVVETQPAIGIVPLFADLTTVLVGQHRYPLDSYSWEIPEGAARPEEELLAAAARELAEETGLTAATWADLGLLHTSNSIMNEVAHLFLAEGLTAGTPDPDETEDLRLRRVPLIEAVRMVDDGEIVDAMSVVALYRVRDLVAVRSRE